MTKQENDPLGKYSALADGRSAWGDGAADGRGETIGISDGELVEQLHASDQQALDWLYDRYQGTVFAVAQKVLQREADAEEVVLEVFWRIWRQPGSYDASRGSVATYLVLMARSRALDKLRSLRAGKRSARTVGDMEQDAQTRGGDPTPAPNELMALQEQREQVHSALEQLSENQQEVLELAFFHPMTHSEIAQRLEIPLGTVKTRIRQGLICLRDHLKPVAGEYES